MSATASSVEPAVLRVAINAPLRSPFDYLPPAGVRAADVPVGSRVRVPLGRRQAIGVVVEHAGQSELAAGSLRAAHELLDATALLDGPLMRLLRWTADYYHHPLGEVIAAALPKGLREGAGLLEQQTCWRLSAQGVVAVAAATRLRAPRQQQLLSLLAQAPQGLGAEELAAQQPGWRSFARALIERGWVESFERDAVAATSALIPVPPPDLTAEQIQAVDSVTDSAGRYAAFVLQGATGSGKSEVYLQCAARVLAQDGGVLVLVPEIGLTPQLVARFRERLAVDLAVLHSGLTDAERLAAWRRAHAGVARVVLGTRSAVFAPVASLGLIVVDEEHDSSYKQHDGGCRYSARDLAVLRAQQSRIPVLLGSATPALETLYNVERARYRLLQLPRRADQAEAPRQALVDVRAHVMRQGLSTPVIESIRRHLQARSQVLVFINRRGYAPTLLCTGCGWIAPCHACDARLTVHQGSAQLRCHHCGAAEPLPHNCPRCGRAVKSVGQGTERVEETLRELFPEFPLARLDRDTASRRSELEAIMQRVHSGEARILVGTQMVTKGHHFPALSLVVVLNADQGLFSTDFRAAERLAQTIVQVAGRAGRERDRGEVLVQTEYPEHPLLQSLLDAGYAGFAATALQERAIAHWPPFNHLALLRASATSQQAAMQFLTQARAAAAAAANVRLLGPVAATMARRAGRYYAQLLIESAERTALHAYLDQWLPQIEALGRSAPVRYVLDVDPIDIQ